MLDPVTLAELRKNVAAQENRAIFEIPEILAKLLGESQSAPTPPMSAIGAADAG